MAGIINARHARRQVTVGIGVVGLSAAAMMSEPHPV